jgi:hypothetical protein
MENIGIFYGHLENIMAVWYSKWPFGNLVVFWYIFPRFGILYDEKSGSPAFAGKSGPLKLPQKGRGKNDAFKTFVIITR